MLIRTPSRREFIKYSGVGLGAAAFLAGQRNARGQMQAIFADTNHSSGVSPITLVDHKGAVSADGLSFTTAALNTTGAKLLVVHAATYQNIAATITDFLSGVPTGNVWTGLTIQTNNSGPAGALECSSRLFYCANPTVGAVHTFTGTTASGFPSGQAVAFGGVTITSPFDVQNGAQAGAFGSLATTIQPGSVTPSLNNELVLCGISIQPSNVTTCTINGGFTTLDFQEHGANNLGSCIAYLIQTSAAAANPTWTVGVSNYLTSTSGTFKNG